jgi:hypothetical protein
MNTKFFKLGIVAIVTILATISLIAFGAKPFFDQPPIFGGSGGDCTESTCPNVDPFDHTILLCNVDDCSSFFMCSNGVPILQKCPEGLHFDADLYVCDWPQSVGCIRE